MLEAKFLTLAQVYLGRTQPIRVPEKQNIFALNIGRVEVDQSGQGYRIGAIQAQIHKPLLAGQHIQVMRQSLLSRCVLSPDHRIADQARRVGRSPGRGH